MVNQICDLFENLSYFKCDIHQYIGMETMLWLGGYSVRLTTRRSGWPHEKPLGTLCGGKYWLNWGYGILVRQHLKERLESALFQSDIYHLHAQPSCHSIASCLV